MADFFVWRIAIKKDYGDTQMVLLFPSGNIAHPLLCLDEYAWRRLIQQYAEEAGDKALSKAASADAWVERQREKSPS